MERFIASRGKLANSQKSNGNLAMVCIFWKLTI
jgi:hypothetical protein